MRNILAPCTAIFLLSATIAGATPIPSGNEPYTTVPRNIISERDMFPHEDFGDMDLAKGFHYRGDTDEGLAPRFKKDLHSIPSTSREPPVPENRGLGNGEPLMSGALPFPTNNRNGAPPATNGENSRQTASRRNLLPHNWGTMTEEERAAWNRDRILHSIANRSTSDGRQPPLSAELQEALAGQSPSNSNGEHHREIADQHSG